MQMIISWCIQLVSVLCHVAQGARSLHTGVTGLLSGDGMAGPKCMSLWHAVSSLHDACRLTYYLSVTPWLLCGWHPPPHQHAKGVNEQWDTLALTGVLITVENEEFTDA